MNYKLSLTTLALAGSLSLGGNALAQSSGSSSIETVLDHIAKNGRVKTTFSQVGYFFNKNSGNADGKAIINQNGELFVQTLGEDAKMNLIYGPQRKIGNVFETRRPDGNYIVTGIYAVDLNQDGLDDIVVDVTDMTGVSAVPIDTRTTKDFYFATGNGKFSKGKSKVYFERRE